MQSTYRYIIKCLWQGMGMMVILCALQWPASGQYRSDTKYGFRLGVDLSRIPVHFLNPYRTDVEVQSDLRVDSNLYIAADAGWNTTHLKNESVFEYEANGFFLKAGVDYNLLKRKLPWESNMLYVGFRYGVARMRRTIPQYHINDPYWGNVNGHFDTKTLLPQWAEVIVGMKAEVASNLFLGWSLHTRILTTPNVDKQVRPYLIPGFGKATGNAVFDFNYTISYRIPLWSPKPKKPKPVREKKSPEVPEQAPSDTTAPAPSTAPAAPSSGAKPQEP